MASERDPRPPEGRTMLILYGSETGNSEESAKDVESMARRLHFRTSLEEMNDVSLSDLVKYPLVIFIISTTGQGELPKNARTFWKSLLRKRLSADCLRQVNFTTFGLGDSSYFQYNWAARKLHKRLEQLGAVEFLPRGEANERHEDSIDGTFLPWCLTLQAYIKKEWPLPPGLEPIPFDVQLPPKFTLELVKQNSAMDTHGGGSTARSVSDSRKKYNSDTGSNTLRNQTSAGRRTRYEVDNHGRELDREAALYSHVNSTPSQAVQLKFENNIDDVPVFSKNMARLSNATAQKWPRGIDVLDRPNVLRDAPDKYTLTDTAGNVDDSPPPDLLPIPGSWVGVVTRNVRLTPESHWQNVRRLVMTVNDVLNDDGDPSYLDFNPGDVAVVYPKNFPQDVQALIDLMDWGDIADQPFQHVPKGMDLPCRTPKHCYPLPNSTLRELLTHNYDITCIPRRTFFSEIAFYTRDPTHQERLREFADPGHSDEFWDYTSRPRRSILEVLQDFPSVRVPYQHIPSVFPAIRGREYSIANEISTYRYEDENKKPDHSVLELVVALIKYKTVLRKTRQGLCSRYIASLEPGTPIAITVRRNPVPQQLLDPSRPLIAIAPGTGIAPIRAVIYRRLANMAALSVEEAGIFLVFGGRNRVADFFFEQEWNSMARRVDIKVVTAFSRDQPHKIYVQDRLLENYGLVCGMLHKGASVFLCGSSGKMPEAVRAALYECMVRGGMAVTLEEAREKLHEGNRFQEEVW